MCEQLAIIENELLSMDYELTGIEESTVNGGAFAREFSNGKRRVRLVYERGQSFVDFAISLEGRSINWVDSHKILSALDGVNSTTAVVDDAKCREIIANIDRIFILIEAEHHTV